MRSKTNFTSNRQKSSKKFVKELIVIRWCIKVVGTLLVQNHKYLFGCPKVLLTLGFPIDLKSIEVHFIIFYYV